MRQAHCLSGYSIKNLCAMRLNMGSLLYGFRLITCLLQFANDSLHNRRLPCQAGMHPSFDILYCLISDVTIFTCQDTRLRGRGACDSFPPFTGASRDSSAHRLHHFPHPGTSSIDITARTGAPGHTFRHCHYINRVYPISSLFLSLKCHQFNRVYLIIPAFVLIKL